jgi:DNA-binding transcriptional ArsR family regulator
MVNYEDQRLDATFAALADPTRRAILARLARHDASVSELARPFRISLPGVHKHLGVLERAGLVAHTKDGRVRRCRLVRGPSPMQDAARWIERYRRFWEARFDALARYLAHSDPEETPQWPPDSNPKPPSPSGSSATSRRPPPGSSAPGRRRRK